MPGIADLIERINEGVLTAGLESNVKINHVSGWPGAQAVPIIRGGSPNMIQAHVLPMW